MQQWDLSPEAMSSSDTIRAFRKGTEPVLPFELSKEMQSELSQKVTSYSAAISAFEKGTEWVLPFELVKQMRQLFI